MRQQIAAWRDAQPARWRVAQSELVWSCFFNLPEAAKARTVMLYASFRSELPTQAAMHHVLETGRRLVLPCIDKTTHQIEGRLIHSLSELVSGAYGIAEPGSSAALVPEADIDIVAVPGIVFDRTIYRIGYGAGYYDRFLPLLRRSALAVGVAFAGQVVPRVPYGALDYRLTCLVTEEEVVRQPRRN